MQTRVPVSAETKKQQNHKAQNPAQLLAEQQSAFEDHRPQAAQLASLQAMMSNSPSQERTQVMQAKMNCSAQVQQMHTLQANMAGGYVAQREEVEEPLQAQVDGEAVQREEVATASEAPKPNNTGLPDNLKSGIESLSGMSMDHVKVHYNSSQPAQLNAHAYAQGSEIHVAPGREQHLPHEAWHVVQQAQGRVKPTMQMKGGVPVNDDVGLEAEADVMGAKAMGLGAMQMRKEGDVGMLELTPTSAPSTKSAVNLGGASGTSIVQRYTLVNEHRIANDHTAAVKVGVNNKLFYATADRIDESNRVMDLKQMPINLTQGAVKGGLVADQTLHTVTPTFVQRAFNFMQSEVTPVAGGGGHMQLPSECEKGAIAVIGAFTQTERSVGNTRRYLPKEHEKARIGELLAQSTAPDGQKDLWYQEWVTMEEAAGWAVSAHRGVYTRAEIDPMFVRLNQPALSQEFHRDFDLNDAGTAYLPDYYYDAVPRARALFERIIRALDLKVGAIETQIMRTVDTGTEGEQNELVNASDLAAQLRVYFTELNYDKAAIDQAIALVPESAQLLQALNAGFRQDQAGTRYESTAMFGKDGKLAALATQVLEAIDRQVVRLTARNTKSTGNGSGLNAEVDPEIGQSYGMLGGHYQVSDDGRWNWHWAAVILKALGDNVTMEAHATHKQGNETHNDRWDFCMYGTQVDGGQTFHDQWKGDGFGKAPITVLGTVRDQSHLQPLLAARGINTLGDAETQTARVDALAIFNFMFAMKEAGTTQPDLVQAYQTDIGLMELALAALPPLFIAMLQADWDQFKVDMQVLIDGVAPPDDQLISKTAAHAIANRIMTAAGTFYQYTSHYQGQMRKRGVFV